MTKNESGLPSIFSGHALKKQAEDGTGPGGIMQHFARAVTTPAPYVPPAAPKPEAPPPELKAAPPRVPEIRFPMWCGIQGKPFLVVAKRDGQKLTMLHNEPMPTGSTGGNGAAPANLGSFEFEYKSWPGCYFCGTKKSRKGFGFWTCSQACGAKFHCMGDVRGISRCACGQLEDRTFIEQEFFDVQGTATKAATGSTPAAAARSATAALPAATSETLRLGRK